MTHSFPLGFRERMIFQLRSLYSRYGYSQYKMNKFEEYDLYARNKEFLISDSVITFTDTNGKLMALKPDVTLSIVKNSRDDSAALQKLYYDENVYRVTGTSRSFKELMQVGLECIGMIDDYSICEVLTLAAMSLKTISASSILDISHLGLLSQLIDDLGIPADRKADALKYIGGKNIHELTRACRSWGIPEEKTALLQKVLALSGAPDVVLPQIKELLQGLADTRPLEQLLRVVDALAGSDIFSMLRFDFSAVGDTDYYNGIVLKGYIQGLPGSVLSGGQYDKLMKKMGRQAGAMGFAVYMDMLEQLEQRKADYDVDALLLYEPGTSLCRIRAQVQDLTEQGNSVMVQPCIPENVRYRQLVTLTGGEGSGENHA